MTNVQASHRSSERGFTLVELAIVMVIIGLLIGGILKGQELIANAKISATVSQMKGIEAALNTFQDKYAAIPGDIRDPNVRLPDCAAAPCSAAGDGDTDYDNVAGAAPAVGDEGVVAFVHLNAANLISGVDGSNTLAFGRMIPAVKAGGGMWLGNSTAAGAAAGFAGITSLAAQVPYMVVGGQVAAVTAANGPLNATTAAQIDRKYDDGAPRRGSVQAAGGGCVTAGPPPVYTESDLSSTCSLVARALN